MQCSARGALGILARYFPQYCAEETYFLRLELFSVPHELDWLLSKLSAMIIDVEGTEKGWMLFLCSNPNHSHCLAFTKTTTKKPRHSLKSFIGDARCFYCVLSSLNVLSHRHSVPLIGVSCQLLHDISPSPKVLEYK